MKARVIHVITMLELGGAQQNTIYTVSHLDRSRFSVALWSGDGGMLNEEARAIPDLDFRIVPELAREVRPARDFTAARRLFTMLRDEVRFSKVPVIVHTHSSKAGVLGRWAARLARAPAIIHTFHGFGFNRFQPLPKKAAFIGAEWITGRTATDRFIAVSRANLEEAVSRGIARRDRIELIRSGINAREFEHGDINKAGKKKSLGLDPHAPLVLMAACLKPQKNPLEFVRVAKKVLEKVPEAQFALAGDGELRAEVEREIKNAGLDSRFSLLGWRRDVAELMWASEVFVLTSLWEGLPRSYLQAVAAGLPIVGTDVDGAREAVTSGKNGWLLPPGDVGGMADKVAELLADPGKAKRIGDSGKDILPEFDIGLMVEKQEDMYERMLASL